MLSENKNTQVYILLVLAMIFYGMSFISTKIALQVFNPISIITFRLIISSLLLGFIFRTRIAKLSKKFFPIMALTAFFQPFCYFLSENYGLQKIDASIGAIIIGMIPVFTPLFSFVFLREKLSWGNGIGIFFAFIGISIIMAPNDIENYNDPVGIVLMFLAVLSAVAYSIVVFKIPGEYKSLDIVFYQNIIGTLFFIPLFISIDVPVMDFNHVPLIPTLNVIFLGIFPSTLSFIFLSKSIRTIGANRTNIFTNLVPVFSVFFAFILLGEMITIRKIIGMGAVICGVIISQLGRYPAYSNDK